MHRNLKMFRGEDKYWFRSRSLGIVEVMEDIHGGIGIQLFH